MPRPEAGADASGAVDLRALDLFGRLLSRPGNDRFRRRLLQRELPVVLDRLAQLEAADLRREAMPTQALFGMGTVLVEAPERIGPFRLTERLGQGGMGDVWRGERDDGLFDQVVAIKLIAAHLDASAAEAFEAERRILAQIDHPDIVRLTDGGVTPDGLPYLIMEYVDGSPFDVAVAGLPLDQRIRLFLQLARVVQFAHGRLVAHADLKPSNIMVDTQGRVRLLDFGIAQLLSREGAAAPSSGAMTREFASPERQAGAPPSIADDVYALGRLLTLVIADGGDGDLAAIAAQACADDADRRYSTVAGLAADLERWLSGLPVAARPATFRYVAGKFIARNRRPVLLASLAVAALLGTTIVATLASIRAEQARADATARYAETHGMANYLIFDVLRRLENQPHSLQLRIDIARTAQGYLNALAGLPSTNRAILMDTARGLQQLAAYQGKPGMANLDQPDAARSNLSRALALIEPLSDDAARLLRARIILDQEAISANTDNDLKLARRQLEAARPLVFRPPAPDPALAASFYVHEANLVSWEGDNAAQIKISQAGLALIAGRTEKPFLALREHLLDQLEEGDLYTHQPLEMLKVAKDEMRLAEEMHRRWPEDHDIISRVIAARVNVGTAYSELSRYAEALAVLQTGSDEARAEAEFEPLDRWAESEFRSVDSTRAQALSFLHQYDAAMKIDQVWTARALAQWRADPRNMRRMRNYVQMLAMTGEAQGYNKRFADQCKTDAATMDVYQQMRRLGALTQSDLDVNVKLLRERMAKNCASLGRSHG